MDRRAEAEQHRQALVSLIVDHVTDNPGQTNAEIASALGLESNYEGRQRNYLTYSLLGESLAAGMVERTKDGASVRYAPPS